jgi:uncharacterized protein (TIGR00255 family)
MTGYGRFDQQSDQFKLSIEIKSVNHRYQEVAFRLPRNLLFLEERLKRLVQREVHRGRVDVYLTFVSEVLQNKSLQCDHQLAEAYLYQLNSLKESFKLKGDVSIEQLSALEGIFEVSIEEKQADSFADQIASGLEEATQQLVLMRQEEGAHLAQDLELRIEELKLSVTEMGLHAPKVKQWYQERLEHRLHELLAGKAEIDEQRLLNEVAIFSEKSNIDEELTRLHSHIKQFEEALKHTHPVGRKLDFIIQEMNREVNTIGSKAHDVSLSRAVIDLKSTLEKMREQVQNIE